MGTDQVPKDHNKIRAHSVLDVNHDGRQKFRLVADSHLIAV